MDNRHLFVSFWKICLDNLPEGGFARRHVSAADAKSYIEEARRNDRLLGVSDADLFAPYRERELDKHNELCDLLETHFDISLAPSDFATKPSDDGVFTINPLRGIQVTRGNRLLIVTCNFTLDDKKPAKPLAFVMAPSTVEFHLIESMAPAQGEAANPQRENVKKASRTGSQAGAGER
jgi:hypothetical protein